MKKSTKFSDVLHIMLHMAESKEPFTSETLSKKMETNPVVIRRVMAGLRECGMMTSEKGHGGGWRLNCDLKKITLYDVYKGVGSPTMFALGNRNESPDCIVEKAVNETTKNIFEEAENLLIAGLQKVTIAEVYGNLRR